MTDKELTLKLDRSRWWILANSPFHGQLVMSLKDVLGNPHGKTACTDGRCIKWDKDFLGKLSEGETRFVLLHETMHCAHGHLWRFPAGSIDHGTANQACGHAINLRLLASKLEMEMPKGGLADPQFDGMAEEEIYAALMAKPQQPKQGGKPQAGQDGQDAGQDDACGDYTAPADDAGQSATQGDKATQGQAEAQGDSLKDVWERRVIQAAQTAKAMQGTLPGDLERLLGKVTASPVDWRQETASFVRNAQSSRNDWTRSPRRHAWQPVIYPSKRQNEIGWIIGVRDTSGSIDDKLAAEFSALLASACAELQCGLILMDCDADIQAEHRIEPGGEVPLKAHGGGGTSFYAPFVRAQELIDGGEQIAGLVYLTDLYGDGQPETEDLPTLWLVTNSQVAKTGRTVQIP